MSAQLPVAILPQPNPTTCGPTCLHAIYRYYGLEIGLEEVIAATDTVPGGGTLAVFLACDALRHGFRATIYTYNLHVFDPTWFSGRVDLMHRLKRQMQVKTDAKIQLASSGYVEFLRLGGHIKFTDLTRTLLRGLLRRSMPILTGLSATYLYRTAREFGPNDDYDDVRGRPSGHFVVLSGYDRAERTIRISDPLLPNPVAPGHDYVVSIDRVIGAILLGVLTHDANLLVIQPRRRPGDVLPRSR
jgi:hypothetical protein